MKSVIKMAALAASAALMPVAAHAQAAAAPAAAAVNSGIAVVNLDAAVENSAAFKAAVAQIQTTYKAQITAVQTRQTALQNELNPLRAEIEALQKSGAAPAVLQPKVNAFQAKANAAQQELGRMSVPFDRSAAYVKEQIGGKVEQALKSAMTAKRVGIVLTPDAVVAAQGGNDLTLDVVTQLNALIPSASITPPANWQPGQGEQQAGAPAGR